MASLKYWLWLASLPGVGGVMKNRLLEHFGGPEEVYWADSGEYFLVEGMTRAAAARLEEKSLEEADRILGTATVWDCGSSPSGIRSIPTACGTSTIRRWCCTSRDGCPSWTMR